MGGVLYVSYNTQPGWAAFVPLRDLLTEHSDVTCRRERARAASSASTTALDFVQRMLDTKPLFTRIANPFKWWSAWRFSRSRDRNYLAHEYFNRDWCTSNAVFERQRAGSSRPS
jgi:hypothetical protein